MYQVLIVDDEKEIRDGLASWPWEDLGVKVAGCCAHGLEALKHLSATPADFILTDIRMPFMDGIELMEIVNRQYPFIHTIVLSGYNEFEYARRAMQLGAADYLLKPVSHGDIATAIGRLVARMDEQKQMEYRLAALKRKSQQLAGALRAEFLGGLFDAPLTDDELEQGGTEGEVLLDSDTYAAAILRLDRVSLHRQRLTDREQDLFAFSLDSILNLIWDNRGLGYHLVNRETLEAMLLSKGSHGRERYEDLLRQMLKYIGLFRSTWSVAAGPVASSPSLIFRSLAAARAALPACLENTVMLCPAPAREPLLEMASPSPAEDGAGHGAPDGRILAKARKYMQDNYCRSITLREVAGHVYVSPGYLSSLFKGCGETFLKYLTALRIGRARELMADSRYKIYEIVEMVGYSDPAYFAEVFKRQTGMAPNEYRCTVPAGQAD